MVAEMEDRRVPDPLAAQEFYSKFETMETLGTGVSSVVKLCMDRKTGKEYAVKIIDVSQEDDVHEGLDAVQQVHQEIAILKLVGGHPYIADLLDVYETPDFVFLIFDLCRKGELYQLLNSDFQLSEKRIRNYMKQLLLGIKHCHQLGIIHRDVKPENILIQDDMDYIKLTDFGLARPLDRSTKLFQLCGTPGYLAPEIYRSGMLLKEHPLCTGYSYPVDAWASGITLYILLLGRPPFYDRKRLKMIKMICERDHATTGNDWATITDEAQDLINRLLDKNPDTRMTIDEALDHAVFRNNAYLRRLNHPANKVESEADEDIPVTVKSVKKFCHKSSIKIYKEKLVNEVVNEVLKPLRKFKRAVNVVKFIVRLSRVRVTPELAHIDGVKRKPQGFTSFRKPAGQVAFKLYNHWSKKSVVQSRASMFQNKPKHFNDDTDECPI